MDLGLFVDELMEKWESYGRTILIDGVERLAEPSNKAFAKPEGIAFARKKLQAKFRLYEFVIADGTKSPLCVIGFRKTRKYWHFALYQIKYSESPIDLKLEANEEFPIFAQLVKDLAYESEHIDGSVDFPMFISTGYLGIQKVFREPSYVSKISVSRPYKHYYKNLAFKSPDRTELMNRLHRNIW